MTKSKSFNNMGEKLYRAVRPIELYWSSDRHITSAVFDLRSGESGVSFDRSFNRSDNECVKFMLQNLTGSVIRIQVKDVIDLNSSDSLMLKYLPSKKIILLRIHIIPNCNTKHKIKKYLIKLSTHYQEEQLLYMIQNQPTRNNPCRLFYYPYNIKTKLF